MDNDTPRYAVFGAYRNSEGFITISRISLRRKSWTEAREDLAVFNRSMPVNASYFIGEFA